MSINEFLIEYKINKDERKVRIFGYEFVRKNKNKCLVEYNNKKFNCTEFIDIDDSSRNEINKNNSIKIKIKLIFINEIIDFQYMFYECSSLLKFTNYSRFPSNKIVNIRSLFSKCENLVDAPDLSNMNISEIKDMDSIFSECKSLSDLRDISKWNTENVKNFYNMFQGCEALKSLPDLSKWETKNATNFRGMFKGCISLI
jgi:surface protein